MMCILFQAPSRVDRVLVLVALAFVLTGCLATSGPPIDRERSPNAALLVLDMQRDFLADDARMPIAREQVAALLTTTNELIARADAAQLDVIYVANAFSSGDLIGNLFRNQAAIEGSTGAEIDPRLDVRGPISTKDAPDAFSNEALDALLRERRVGHLFLVGVFADQCVYWTARGALNRGYRVTAIPEGLGAADAEHLTDALRDLRDAGVEVLEPNAWQAALDQAALDGR